MTQLSAQDIRKQIEALEKVRIYVCDTTAFDHVCEAINQLKKTHNEITGFKRYKVE